jgi:hypothetical protein
MSFVCKKVLGRGINIFAARVLDPIRQELGLEKLNFQILRRTYTTTATLENYGKDILESVYARTR